MCHAVFLNEKWTVSSKKQENIHKILGVGGANFILSFKNHKGDICQMLGRSNGYNL